MRDPLSRGPYKFPRTPNKLDEYIQQEEKTAKAAKGADEFKDLSKLGGVWEKDLENLTNDFITYKQKRVEYEKEKDAVKKTQLWQESIKLGAALETNIAKSKKQKQQYIAKAEEINKDNKLFYGEDAKDRLEQWAGKAIYERPDDVGVERPSTIDFGEEAKKRFFTTVKTPDTTQSDVKVGDKIIRKGSKYYTKDDVEKGLDITLNSMPPNYVRSEVHRLRTRAAGGTPDVPATPQEQLEAIEALKTPDNTNKYLKSLIYAKVEPALSVSILESKPAPERKAGGAGGTQPKRVIEKQWIDMQSVDNPSAATTERYAEISSVKTEGKQTEREFRVTGKVLKEANARYNLGIRKSTIDKLDDSKEYSIKGTFVRALKNQRTGNRFVMINPKQFEDNYIYIESQIPIQYAYNKAQVKAELEGQSADDIWNKMSDEGVKTEVQPLPEVPGTRKDQSKPKKGTTKGSGTDYLNLQKKDKSKDKTKK